MSCLILNGISKDCTSNVGGLRQVYLIRRENITGVAFTNQQVTAITTDFDFQIYFAPRNSASYTVDINIDDFGVQEYTQTLNFRINKRNVTKHTELLAIADGNKDLVALVQDGNNNWFLLGYPYGLNLVQHSGGSGTNKGEGSSYQLSLSGIAPELEYSVADTVIAGLI
jgi:hypothetical protein